MWTGRCLATKADGTQCTKRSLEAYWVWGFQGEQFEHPTWIEVCETHVGVAMRGGMISSLDIRHHTEKV